MYASIKHKTYMILMMKSNKSDHMTILDSFFYIDEIKCKKINKMARCPFY